MGKGYGTCQKETVPNTVKLSEGPNDTQLKTCRLPPELMDVIVHYVAAYTENGSPRAIDNLRSLRLVNQHLAASAASALFHTVPLRITKSSLSKVVAISNHPSAAQYVKRIVFSSLELAFPSIELLEAVTYRCSNQRLKEIRAWKNFVNAQISLFKDPSTLIILSKIFKKMTQLESVVIIPYDPVGTKEIIQLCGSTFGREICSDANQAIHLLVQALGKADRKLRELCFDDTFISADSYRHLIGLRLRGTNPAALAKAFPHTYDVNSNILLSNIRELKIPSLCDVDHTFHPREVARIMSGIIACSPKLETLILGRLCYYGGSQISISDLFERSLHLTYLKKLELDCCLDLTEEELPDFFRRHASTLTDVTLIRARIKGEDDWLSVLDNLKDTEFPLLTSFLLRVPVHAWIYDTEVAGYICGKTELNLSIDEWIVSARY